MITHKIKNIALLVMAILLLISGVAHYLTFRWNESQKSDLLVKNSQLRDTIAINSHILATEKAISDSLKVKIKTNATQNEVALKRKETTIATLSGKLAEKRVLIQPMIDTTALLKEFVDVYDSTNQAKDEYIVDLKLRHAAEVVDLNALVDSQAKQIMAAVTTGEAWRTTAESAQKGETKANRKVKFWKGVTVAVTVAAATVVTIVTLKE